ncbi:hypothetical protein SDC9_196253 [bioreactor metagenome]|uniref:Uncharacterized protein n=1 Tax=bioreactor metagenome TaxID=1076179 RepID=A0A645ICT9_9ZZZZ
MSFAQVVFQQNTNLFSNFFLLSFNKHYLCIRSIMAVLLTCLLFRHRFSSLCFNSRICGPDFTYDLFKLVNSHGSEPENHRRIYCHINHSRLKPYSCTSTINDRINPACKVSKNMDCKTWTGLSGKVCTRSSQRNACPFYNLKRNYVVRHAETY